MIYPIIDFFLGIQNGDFTKVKFYLDYCDYSGGLPYKGTTALIHACKHNQPKIVKLLLENIDLESLNWVDKRHKTALWVAIERDHYECVHHLLNKHYELKKIDQKLNLDWQNENGVNVLMYACQKGDSFLVDVLLYNGADPNLTDIDNLGYTALMYACERDDIKVVKSLLKYKAKKDMVNGRGQIAIDLCDNDEIRKLLL